MQEAIKRQRESLDKQRGSLRQQLGDQPIARSLPAIVDPMAPLAPSEDCTSLPKDQVDSLIAAAARKEALEPTLLRAVIKQESGFRPCAISVKGAQGLMQLMPATAQQFRVSDPFDPEQNVQAGAAYLKQLLNKFNGDLRLALVGYNAGPNRAGQSGGASYPFETQNYVTSIFAELGISAPETVDHQQDSAATQEPMPAGDQIDPASKPR